ncbi:unnamed protein product [Rhizophagus irregularis]|nr:unnamed protein product [Rhizophagus irregularis]CAB5387397.1 unnamed protein product [Rhizophagus irregularis]
MNITVCAATNCVEDPVPLGGAEMMPTNGEVVDVIIGRLVWRVLGQVTDSTERLELVGATTPHSLFVSLGAVNSGYSDCHKIHIALVKTSWYLKKGP